MAAHSISNTVSKPARWKRLKDAGAGLTLRNLSEHLRELFHLAGFDTVFDIE